MVVCVVRRASCAASALTSCLCVGTSDCQRRYGDRVQRAVDFAKAVPVVDIGRHFQPDNSVRSTVMMTYYTTE
jgi:hypothetical protein